MRVNQGLQHRRGPARRMSRPVQATSSNDEGNDPIVQYIVLRRDLWAEQGWPLGPLIAQACHASVAALWLSKDDPASQQYVSDDCIDSMHKVCGLNGKAAGGAWKRQHRCSDPPQKPLLTRAQGLTQAHSRIHAGRPRVQRGNSDTEPFCKTI